MLEPKVASGTGTNRPGIAPSPARATSQVREPSISSCTNEIRGDYVFTSHDPVTGQDRKTPPFLSCPQRSSFANTDANKVDGRNEIFGFSTKLTSADLRMPADGISEHFRPLLEIRLGAHKLPIFLYAPDPRTNWPLF